MKSPKNISPASVISEAESLTFVDLSVNCITSIAPLKDTHRLTALILDGNCITDYYTASDNKELISALEYSNHKYKDIPALLCRHAGLDMFCVSSDTHMWNIIRLEGKYYHVDALWDEENDKKSPIYFNRSTEFIQSMPDHEHDLNRYPHADDMPFSEYEYLIR